MSINHVTLSGNLTRDPEIRSTQSGMDILNFGMAVNDRRRNSATGEWEDYANFIDYVNAEISHYKQEVINGRSTSTKEEEVEKK